ncbi:hypothetical protein FF38_03297, partial [Lucilia cuprina]
MTTYMKVFNERYLTLSKGVDETVDSWFLMSSPGPVFSIVAVYLILVLKIGPTFMKSRKAYDLKKVMIAYNAFQVCYSIWMCRTGGILLRLLWVTTINSLLRTLTKKGPLTIIDMPDRIPDTR